MTLTNLGENIDINILHLMVDNNESKFLPFVSRLSGFLSTHPVLNLNQWFKLPSPNTEFICFDKFIIANAQDISQRSFRYYIVYEQKSVNFIKSSIYFDYRNHILQYYELDPLTIPQQHQIVLFKKTFPFSKAQKFPRSIGHLSEIDTHLHQQYPNIDIQTVAIAEIPFKQQLELMLQTSILITPPGGISTLIPFVPMGAHVIVLDFPSLVLRWIQIYGMHSFMYMLIIIRYTIVVIGTGRVQRVRLQGILEDLLRSILNIRDWNL